MTMVGSTTSEEYHDALSAAPVAKKRSFADLAELAWIGWTVFYAVVRFAVAWGGFNEHGANPWIFGIIDVGTAYPYAKATANICRRGAKSEWSRMGMPIAVAVTTFFAPYAYLWFAAGSMPDGLRFGMIMFVSVFLIAAVVGLTLKIRKLRKQEVEATTADLHSAAPQTELVIDLRDGDAKVERSITS